ncbi:serine/threonine-protein kinase [Dictyobacter arantiisoli]|uniref:non-specific serine/threonine protein kinase n=1 Tax=Dictyobacter arantiisoli TaxID=2014874 RepID=A0A5A5TAG4_9CHLR|nr:serine/threonine-protein kinase [Dictyobacter arantiisoli]GCF08388.1 hypothetical protein KDI_19520 [Dictyobacter arantiisoli]
MKLWRYNRPLEILGQRYRLDGVLGSGGMADVCLAWDEHDAHEVAIKVIKPNDLDQQTLDRFLKEAAQVARWRHPNILRIYGDVRLELLDVRQGSIVPYIVMEYARNGDLQKRLRPGTAYPFSQTLTIFEQLCEAVSYAHAQGVIHRDLKPLNILFRALPDGSEQMVLSDFGLAVEKDASHFTFAAGGTLPYMAPEQLRGQAEAASDIFALGVILYQLCTGRLPFRRSLVDLRRRDPLPTPPRPGMLNSLLPPELDAVIMQALSEQPQQRYPDALDFWAAIQEVVSASTIAAISRREALRRTLSNPSMQAMPDSSSGMEATNALPRVTRSSHPSQPGLRSRRDTRRIPAMPGNTAHLPAMQAQVGSDIIEIGNRQTGRQQAIQARSQQTGRRTAIQARSQQTGGQAVLSNRGPITPSDSEQSAMPRDSSASHRSQPLSIAEPDEMLPMPGTPSTRQHSAPGQPVTTGTRKAASVSRRWLIGGGILVLMPILGLLFVLIAPGLGLIHSNKVTVTINPLSQTITDSQNIQLVNGPTNTQQLQAPGHTISINSLPQNQTVQGTGHKHTNGTVARGMLTFLNGSFNPFSVSTAITIPGPNGVQFLTDGPFTIPANDPNTKLLGKVTVPAHATQIGAQGNIQALAINQACCTQGNFVAVKNTAAFTGGQDAQDYTFVQQGDVDAVVKTLAQGLESSTRSALGQQVPAGEQLLTESVQCQPTVKTEQPVGDKGHNVTSTKATVTLTCSGTSYNKEAVQKLVQTRLQQKALATLGTGYAQVGSLQTTETSATTQSGALLSLLTTSSGRWTYQLSESQQEHLREELAGKQVTVAQNLINGQKGVATAFISMGENGASGSNNTAILPTDPSAITIIIRQP